MSFIETIVLTILLALIAGGLYVGIRLLRSGKRRCSPSRRFTGGLITTAALCYAGYLGVGLWDWHDSRTNPLRIFEDQLGVAPPTGVKHLQAAYVRRGSKHEYYVRWECDAGVLAGLIPKGYTQHDSKDWRQIEHPTQKEPVWWDLSFSTPGLVLWARWADETESYLLAYDGASQTAWFYTVSWGSDLAN